MRQDMKRKGKQKMKFPSNPNIKNRIKNQLRMNSKDLFKPSLKYP
jgi:hypothetical protein